MDSNLEGKSLRCAHGEHVPPSIGAFPLWDKLVCLVGGYPVGEGNCSWTLPDLEPVCWFWFWFCVHQYWNLCFLCWNLRLLCFGVIKLIKMGNTPSIPKGSPLGCIVDKWAKHSHEPMTKKDLIYYYNRVWTQYMLGTEEQWPRSGLLNYYLISQKYFAKEQGKDEIPYAVEAFTLLHQEEKESEGCHLTV